MYSSTLKPTARPVDARPVFAANMRACIIFIDLLLPWGMLANSPFSGVRGGQLPFSGERRAQSTIQNPPRNSPSFLHDCFSRPPTIETGGVAVWRSALVPPGGCVAPHWLFPLFMLFMLYARSTLVPPKDTAHNMHAVGTHRI